MANNKYLYKRGKGSLNNVFPEDLYLISSITEEQQQNLQQTLDVGNTATTGMVIYTPSGNQSIIFPGVIEVGNSDLSIEVAIEPGLIRTVDSINSKITSIMPDGFYLSPNYDVNKIKIEAPVLTDDRIATLQDASGVIAYLSDIPTVTTPSLQDVITVDPLATSRPDFRGGIDARQEINLNSGITGNIFKIFDDSGVSVVDARGGVGYNFATLIATSIGVSQDALGEFSGIIGYIDSILLTDSQAYNLPDKSGIFALLDDIPVIVPVSSSQAGIVNNTSLQELGGVDKLINGVKIGRGNNNIVTNTALGNGVLPAITTGNNIVALGTAALAAATTANANTAVGAYALYVNQTGINNTALGNFALQNTTAANNTALGYGAGAANTSGTRNTIIGTGAQISSTTANNNTTIGAAAGQNNTTGSSNVFVGWMAGGNTTTGAGNVIIGTQATVGTGISTGSNNLIIAPNAGNGTGITTGSGNVVIGKITGLTASSTNTINISDGVGNIMLRKLQTGEILAPALTPALINSGGNPSIITKEYLDSAITALPFNNYIPLTGTTVGNPVTGNIELSGEILIGALTGSFLHGLEVGSDYIGLYRNALGTSNGGVLLEINHTQISYTDEGQPSTYLDLNSNQILVNGNLSNSHKGLQGNVDFSPNYNDLSYVQKTYVDNLVTRQIEVTSDLLFDIVPTSNTIMITYTGTTTTTKLPPIAGNEGAIIFLTNSGSGAVTVNSDAGGNDIWEEGSESNTTSVPTGTVMRIINNSLKWTVL